jgi:glyoxylate reductase
MSSPLHNNSPALPRVVADGPLAGNILELLQDRVTLLPWSVALEGSREPVDGVYTYGHPLVDGAMLDRLPGVRVISNYGVGVDHIRLPAAAARGIPVGNTPGIRDGATADMAFALLMAAARRVVEGDRYARSPAFTHYDPGYMLGREVHGATIGIVGLGRIGEQIARRARGFDMTILYHNRRRNEDREARCGARYVPLEELLATADYVVLSVPLTKETHQLIGVRQLAMLKPTAILVNVSRGPGGPSYGYASRWSKTRSSRRRKRRWRRGDHQFLNSARDSDKDRLSSRRVCAIHSVSAPLLNPCLSRVSKHRAVA